VVVGMPLSTMKGKECGVMEGDEDDGESENERRSYKQLNLT
jgi:hypothetical protein